MPRRFTGLWITELFTLMVVVVVVCAESVAATDNLSLIHILLTGVKALQAAATYTHGNLVVTIPYHGASEGSGRLVAELLDPEDNVLGRAERATGIGKGDGAWQVTIMPEKAIPFDEIIWQRLRIVASSDSGWSVSSCLLYTSFVGRKP